MTTTVTKMISLVASSLPAPTRGSPLNAFGCLPLSCKAPLASLVARVVREAPVQRALAVLLAS